MIEIEKVLNYSKLMHLLIDSTHKVTDTHEFEQSKKVKQENQHNSLITDSLSNLFKLLLLYNNFNN